MEQRISIMPTCQGKHRCQRKHQHRRTCSRHRIPIRNRNYYHQSMVAEVVLRLPLAVCRNGASQHHHGMMEEELWQNSGF